MTGPDIYVTGITDAGDFCATLNYSYNEGYVLLADGEFIFFNVGASSEAKAINVHAGIVGDYDDGSGVVHGYFKDTVLFGGRIMAPVDYPGSTETVLLALNDGGRVIVGNYVDSVGVTHGLILQRSYTWTSYYYPARSKTSLNGSTTTSSFRAIMPIAPASITDLLVKSKSSGKLLRHFRCIGAGRRARFTHPNCSRLGQYRRWNRCRHRRSPWLRSGWDCIRIQCRPFDRIGRRRSGAAAHGREFVALALVQRGMVRPKLYKLVGPRSHRRQMSSGYAPFDRFLLRPPTLCNIVTTAR